MKVISVRGAIDTGDCVAAAGEPRRRARSSCAACSGTAATPNTVVAQRPHGIGEITEPLRGNVCVPG
jgi:hypothetical protein